MYALLINDHAWENEFISSGRYDTVEEAREAGESLVKVCEDRIDFKVIAV